MQEDDKFSLSQKFCAEVEHCIQSPAFAAQQIGYPPEALGNTVRLATLQPVEGSNGKAITVQLSDSSQSTRIPLTFKEERARARRFYRVLLTLEAHILCILFHFAR